MWSSHYFTFATLVKKKKIRQRNLGELMGIIAPTPSSVNKPTTSHSRKEEVNTVSEAAPPAMQKQPRPSLPSLKKTPSFSIKDAMAGKMPPASATEAALSQTSSAVSNLTSESIEEEEELVDNNIEEVELTPKNLEIAWNKFADYIKPARPRIYHTLMSTKPTLMEDNLVTFDVMNTLQKDDLMNICNELVNFLRRSLGTPMLELVFNLADIESTNSRPYTVEEKFKHMIQKNPAVLTLKQTLGLDFE